MFFEGGGAMLKHLSKVKIDYYAVGVHVALSEGNYGCGWCYWRWRLHLQDTGLLPVFINIGEFEICCSPLCSLWESRTVLKFSTGSSMSVNSPISHFSGCSVMISSQRTCVVIQWKI
jgi:hypothetical protein